MRPLLTLAGILSAGLCGSALGKFEPGVWIFGGLLTGTVGLFGGAYVYFMRKDPNRLQTESFLARMNAMDLLRQKGGNLTVGPGDLEALSNPFPDVPKQIQPPSSGHSDSA